MSGGIVTLTRLDGAAPVLLTLTQPTWPDSSAIGVTFNHDGSMLTFSGAQERELPDVYCVKLGAIPSAPMRVHPALPDAEMAYRSGEWSPDGKWLIYGHRPLDGETVGSYAIDVSGASPAAPIQLNGSRFGTPTWLPLTPAIIAQSIAGTRTLNLFEFESRPPAVEPAALYTGADLFGFRVNPRRNVVGFSTSTALHFIDTEAPQAVSHVTRTKRQHPRLGVVAERRIRFVPRQHLAAVPNPSSGRRRVRSSPPPRQEQPRARVELAALMQKAVMSAQPVSSRNSP